MAGESFFQKLKTGVASILPGSKKNSDNSQSSNKKSSSKQPQKIVDKRKNTMDSKKASEEKSISNDCKEDGMPGGKKRANKSKTNFVQQNIKNACKAKQDNPLNLEESPQRQVKEARENNAKINGRQPTNPSNAALPVQPTTPETPNASLDGSDGSKATTPKVPSVAQEVEINDEQSANNLNDEKNVLISKNDEKKLNLTNDVSGGSIVKARKDEQADSPPPSSQSPVSDDEYDSDDSSVSNASTVKESVKPNGDENVGQPDNQNNTALPVQSITPETSNASSDISDKSETEDVTDGMSVVGGESNENGFKGGYSSDDSSVSVSTVTERVITEPKNGNENGRQPDNQNNKDATALSVNDTKDVSVTTSNQVPPVSEDVSQNIQSEILVPLSSVSPDVGNVSTAENINDNMVASEISGQADGVQSNDGQSANQNNAAPLVQPTTFTPNSDSDDEHSEVFSTASDGSYRDDEEEPLLSTENDKSKQPSDPDKNNTAPQSTKSSKWPTVATWMFTVAGILAGAAAPTAYFAFSVSLLTTGIIASVGVCCLVAALIIYCCNRPSSSLEGSNVEPVANGKLVGQP